MITKENEPIYARPDGTYVIQLNGCGYHCTDSSGIKKDEVAAYLAEHPEALVPEPAPPAPTPEQLKEREIAEKLAYLASTDWYVVRFAETGVAIPVEITTARSAARARIDELGA